MLDWDKLRIFIPVAKSENISYAASELGLHQSTISRHISALEEQLGMPLFHRTNHGITLTQQGASLYESCQRMSEILSSSVNDINDSQEMPQGRLRIHSSVSFGSRWLSEIANGFIKQYPKMSIDFILNNKDTNLSSRESDAALRMHSTNSSEIIEKKLFSFNLKIYAAKSYLKKYGEPKEIEEIIDHNLISFGDSFPKPFHDINWLNDYLAGRKKPKLTINNISGIYFCIKAGLGIGTLPAFLLPEDSDLQQILPHIDGPKITLYLVYPTSLRGARRIQIFYKYLNESKATILQP